MRVIARNTVPVKQALQPSVPNGPTISASYFYQRACRTGREERDVHAFTSSIIRTAYIVPNLKQTTTRGLVHFSHVRKIVFSNHEQTAQLITKILVSEKYLLHSQTLHTKPNKELLSRRAAYSFVHNSLIDYHF